MFKRILVPLDGSKLAEQALPYAEELATKFGATVYLVRAIPKPDVPAAPLNVAAVEDMAEQQAERYLDRIEKRLADANIKVETRDVVGQNATEVIKYVASEEQVDLIIVVSRGRSGLLRTIFGSTIDDLVRDPSQPVLVIKGEE